MFTSHGNELYSRFSTDLHKSVHLKETVTGDQDSFRLSDAPVGIDESESDWEVVDQQHRSDHQRRDATPSRGQTTNEEDDGSEAEDENEDAVVEADPVAGD